MYLLFAGDRDNNFTFILFDFLSNTVIVAIYILQKKKNNRDLKQLNKDHIISKGHQPNSVSNIFAFNNGVMLSE